MAREVIWTDPAWDDVENAVKVYCWRGDKAHGAPDHPLIHRQKNLSDHGYSLATIKEWRIQESNAGRPSSLDDFIQEHGLCVECRATGIKFDRSSDEPHLCSVCGGSGKEKPSESLSA